MKKLLLVCAALLLPVLAQAEGDKKLYAELEHSSHRISIDGSGADPHKLSGVGLNIGYVVLGGLALEGVVGRGTGSDTQTMQGVDVTLRGGTSYGLYARPFLAVGDTLEVFARIGYIKGKSTTTVFGNATTETAEDASYGAGAAYKFRDNLAITMGYMVYFNKNGTRADGYTLALRRYF